MKNETNWTKYFVPRQNDAGKWETRVTDANDKVLRVVEHDTEEEAQAWQLDCILRGIDPLIDEQGDSND